MCECDRIEERGPFRAKHKNLTNFMVLPFSLMLYSWFIHTPALLLKMLESIAILSREIVELQNEAFIR